MTSALVPGSWLIVVGVDLDSAEVARLALGHGDDPKDSRRNNLGFHV